jgi:hypothetical protein
MDMCGSDSFHYTESGFEPSHGSYFFKYDTVVSIYYISNASVAFNNDTFFCSAATDSVITFNAQYLDSTAYKYSIEYNRLKQNVTIFRGHNYMNSHGYVNMGPSSEKWVSY